MLNTCSANAQQMLDKCSTIKEKKIKEKEIKEKKIYFLRGFIKKMEEITKQIKRMSEGGKAGYDRRSAT